MIAIYLALQHCTEIRLRKAVVFTNSRCALDTIAAVSSESPTVNLTSEILQLLNKINAALEKIEQGVYGECENCGEEIGLKRLEARPVAELCIDCKAEQEKLERRMG